MNEPDLPAAPMPSDDSARFAEPEAGSEPFQTHAPADPTRFGDWERNGRCIDF